MNALINLNTSEFILKANKFKKTLLQIEELTWTDLLVICTIDQLGQTDEPVTSAMVVEDLKMNRCWIYKSVRRLQAKGFILVSLRPKEPSRLAISNWGKILLLRAGELLYQKS